MATARRARPASESFLQAIDLRHYDGSKYAVRLSNDGEESIRFHLTYGWTIV